MTGLNSDLLFSSELADELYSSPINGTTSRGTYNPMQFVLRLRKDIHQELAVIEPGISGDGKLTYNQIQAFSTYLHETIHWWQHVGSNFGFISSLKFPAQAHITHDSLAELLATNQAFKSIRKYDSISSANLSVNKILNYWHDIEYAGQIAFDPNRIKKIALDPYFDCWGHCYNLMWGSSLWTLASTVDNDFEFLPNIKTWEFGFRELRNKKIKGFYYGSDNTIPPIGIRAIYEGQARFSQLQYLYMANLGKLTMNDFLKAGMLSGIYIEALSLFLDIIREPLPIKLDDPLIGLFLLICEVAINPTDGFPFDISYYESFIMLNDPGYRFCILCQMVRDRHKNLKTAILNYSKDEYLTVSKILSDSISCLSPHDGTSLVLKWIKNEDKIKNLLEEETIYKYTSANLPVRLFFSKFLRFQEDKFTCPQFFCWPGMNFVGFNETVDLNRNYILFEKHKALFIDDVSGDIYHSAINNYTEKQMDETLNEFFSWNSTYDMVRQWIIHDGPFNYNYQWLTSKFSKEQMKQWACNNFEASFGVHPDSFKII